MGTGNIRIQARTADEALPLSNVQIRIRDQQGRLLYDLLTDESGEAGPVSLYTADGDLSKDPKYRGAPYTRYNLEAVAKGFTPLNIQGIPIFDGETAIQPVELLPIPSSKTRSFSQTIKIGKPAVESSEPRKQVGEDANGRDPRLLNQVIIPDPIVVHLGAPSEAASNVRVSFIDYIKNVASSEIYPTWPPAALEANIYAIITFALNRVYTEWYRNRGYDFDITSSTAYDQSYQYGHPVYESISNIVDEIFNQYVHRDGLNEPYFTTFCNGTTVTCSGLSQWGTVPLAEQGMTALEILRQYYPEDIIIGETNVITGIVESYPGAALRRGSTGQAVEKIQTFLNRIRRNYPAIPQITDAPGDFGSSTEAAVREFQSIFNLNEDGIVGNTTWNKISAIYTAVAKLAALDSEGTTYGIGRIPPGSILRNGSSGVDVLTLQFILSFLSNFYPTIPQPPQDGIFGATTAQAVRAFQQMRGVTADGIVGSATWNALYDTYWSIINDIPLPGTGEDEGGETEYTVQSGDSLWLIAQYFGTTVEAIKDLNQLTSDIIQVGQVLLIPDQQAPQSIDYVVKDGDTLWLLSQRFHTTVDAIRAVNDLTCDGIMIGQVLKIPQ